MLEDFRANVLKTVHPAPLEHRPLTFREADHVIGFLRKYNALTVFNSRARSSKENKGSMFYKLKRVDLYVQVIASVLQTKQVRVPKNETRHIYGKRCHERFSQLAHRGNRRRLRTG